jgi:hypothetical protein
MRLGGYFVAQSVEDLDPLCEKLDHYGLSASPALRSYTYGHGFQLVEHRADELWKVAVVGIH